MIYINLDNQDYYDDALVLVKSFYPGEGVAAGPGKKEITDVVITPVVPPDDGKGKSQLHDEFKAGLYHQLSEATGRALPWGKLTGVRPSKLAMKLLDAGSTDDEVLGAFMEDNFVTEGKARLALEVAHRERELLSGLDCWNGYSLYIGIPFCPTTCLYCSFTSYSIREWRDKVDDYLGALSREMRHVAGRLRGRRLDTVYIGGGTPTTLEPYQLDRLLTELEDCFPVGDCLELTVEAGRPDSITREKLEVLRSHNVGRISINPQTMNQDTLDLIGRKHTVGQVREAFFLARECGFDNINMDIILGLPGEDEAKVHNTLREIGELHPDSLTVHSLAIKRAAALNLWKDEHRAYAFHNTDEIIRASAECAKGMGMEPYYMYRQKNMAGNFENVGYAVPSKECVYNILIMEERQSIIALGAGASTKLCFPDGDSVRIERIENVKSVRDYILRIDEMLGRKDGSLFNGWLSQGK
jgi:oxygen-independent coproporphyrinogen-3 oxidase